MNWRALSHRFDRLENKEKKKIKNNRQYVDGLYKIDDSVLVKTTKICLACWKGDR